MKVFSVNKKGLKRQDWKSIENYRTYNIPILYLNGSIAGISKENKVTLNYSYKEHSGTCTLKWQGALSLDFQKKNYTIKFDNAFEVVSGWGAQDKYCLKANFVDPSHARNIVLAKLWGQIVKSRSTQNATLNALPNGGAIDGFPIIISLNGKFHGLYTWNIPKEGWMFGMSGTDQQQAIVCADWNNNGAAAFKGLATFTTDSDGYVDFEVEYSSDDDSTWVLASLNNLIAAVMNSDGTNIEYGITPYLDWDSAIDYYIHYALSANYDGTFRNYLLYTYDGVKWGISVYDMDVVLGNRAAGKYFYAPNNDQASLTTFATNHKLFELIWKYKRPQLRARFNELTSGIMSAENVMTEFQNFSLDIPLPVLNDDARLWQQLISGVSNNLYQIITYYPLRLKYITEQMAITTGEQQLPEQINPNLYTVTTSLTGCTNSNSTTSVTKGATYSATITASDGYTLDGATVSITMGGTDITSSAYSDGVISISSVTGNITINVVAIEDVGGYTNQVPISIDTDGSVFNETGWIGATRLSSSGSTKTVNYVSTTGYIPAKANDVIRIAGSYWLNSSYASTNYVCSYDSSFSFISAVNNGGVYGGGTVSGDENVAVVTLTDNANIAYIRVSSSDGYETAGTNGPGAKMIVTVNQEITD